MLRNIFLLVFALLIIVNTGNSQTNPMKFGLFGTVSLPVGDFGDNSTFRFDTGSDGFATTGFGAGVELLYQFDTPGLAWHNTAAFLYQGFDDKVLTKEAKDEFGEDINVDAGNYFIIPVLTGISYATQISPTMKFIFIGQLGLSFIKKTDITLEYTRVDDGPYDLIFEMASSFTFGIGAGLIINDKFCISMRYLGMGEPEFDLSLEERGKVESTSEWETSVSTFLITAGIYF